MSLNKYRLCANEIKVNFFLFVVHWQDTETKVGLESTTSSTSDTSSSNTEDRKDTDSRGIGENFASFIGIRY